MSTVIRPEISRKKVYFIEKHRYYELKHFCLQYPIWKKAYNSISNLKPTDLTNLGIFSKGVHSDPTQQVAIAKDQYKRWMELVEDAAKKTDSDLWEYIFKAVTEEISYPRLEIPCCKEVYYDLYRRFFWILSHSRN